MRLAYLHGNAFYKLYKGCIKLHVGNDCCPTIFIIPSPPIRKYLYWYEILTYNASEFKGSFVLFRKIYVSGVSTRNLLSNLSIPETLWAQKEIVWCRKTWKIRIALVLGQYQIFWTNRWMFTWLKYKTILMTKNVLVNRDVAWNDKYIMDIGVINTKTFKKQ